AAGLFFAGGGPAAGLGSRTHRAPGYASGRWILREGRNGFGGTLALRGLLGGRNRRDVFTPFGLARRMGISGTGSWAVLPPLGRLPYASPTAYSAFGAATNWANPHEASAVYVTTTNGTQTTAIRKRGSGTRWTTGTVTLYARSGAFSTTLRRAGRDTITPDGARSLQLVTPTLTHWRGPGFENRTGHVGILRLRLVPEPARALLLAAGLVCLVALSQAQRCR
ncbi:MAG TPA: hypothetical protein VIY27_12080, partial [Myxococcota bacterium]